MPAELRAEMARAVRRGGAGLGRGEGDVELRALPAGCSSATSSCGASTSTASSRRGRAVRRPPRRLRAGDEDGRGDARSSTRSSRRARAADRRAARPRGRRLVPHRRLPARRASVALAHEVVDLFGHRPDTLAHRPDRASVRVRRRLDDIRITTHYYPDSLKSLFSTMHEYGHGLYSTSSREHLERLPIGGAVLARDPRVAEPALGEPRRPQPAVLALLLSAPAGDVPGAARRRRARALLRRDQPRRSRR